jgi:cyclohexa-1,5-dienecarbonyl-CoA hydratase
MLRLVLDAPPGNLLDNAMVDALHVAVSDAAGDPAIKALIFDSTGEHFSYGAKIQEHRPEEIAASLPRFHALFRTLFDAAIPTIAIVRGRCLGGGLELAAFCNWIFAAPDAQLGTPEIRLGVFPPVGALVLRERVTRSMAEMLCVTGRILTAEEGLEIGLVDDIAEDPSAAAVAWIASNLLPHSAVALRHAIRAVRQPMRESFRRDLDAVERLYLDGVMRTADAKEGIEAFLAKRPPQWKDC